MFSGIRVAMSLYFLCSVRWANVCLFLIFHLDICLRLLITPLLTFLKCRNILNLSSSPVFSGIRLIFSLCSVLLTNVCLLVICLRDIVLMLLISTLVTFLKCRYSLNHYRYLIFISVLVVILFYT